MDNFDTTAFRLVGLICATACAAGCTVAGPAAIRGGRMAYNDAIVATNDQQVLAMIVRMRYGESTGLMAVTSVTANMQIRASAGAEVGFGPVRNYEGNLVPLSLGVAYEENPTISYAPVQGEKYLRQLLSPLPLDLTVLLLNSSRTSPHVPTLLLRSINGMQNPGLRTDPTVMVDPEFTELAGVMADLGRQGHLTWSATPGETSTSVMAITGEGAAFEERRDRLFNLLGVPAPDEVDGVVTVPVLLGIGQPKTSTIHLETRSLYELFILAGASIDIPAEHRESGIASPLPAAGAAAESMRIRCSKKAPDMATTAIQHHGWWYYIDNSDATSKLTFRVLESLMSVRIADTLDHERSLPVLTVPVSR